MFAGIPLRSIYLIHFLCTARWVLPHQKKPGSCLHDDDGFSMNMNMLFF